jgi:hypothetical protein
MPITQENSTNQNFDAEISPRLRSSTQIDHDRVAREIVTSIAGARENETKGMRKSGLLIGKGQVCWSGSAHAKA